RRPDGVRPQPRQYLGRAPAEGREPPGRGALGLDAEYGALVSGWPSERFLALSGARLPIVQAPMAGAGGAARSLGALKGGAVGSLPCAMRTPGELVAEVAEVRAAAAGPLNLNFFCHDLPDDQDDSAWRALLRPVYEAAGIPPDAGGGAVRQPFREELCAA